MPGLKVVAPSTPADARALLLAAIRDDNPVVFLEHRGLYWTRGEVPDTDDVRLGEAVIRRPGTDVTIVSWSRMVGTALEAADVLASEGVEVEVVDARTLVPLDLETILASVRRTGHLVVAHEAVRSGGAGAEIAATVAAAAPDVLRAPVGRVGAPFAPVPASPELEALFVPSAAQIVDVVRATLGRTAAPVN